MISSAAGHRCAARVGDYVRPRRGLFLVLGTAVALSLACGSQDALVGAQDPDEGPKGAGTSGIDRGAAGNSTGGARSTGTVGGAPMGGTGEGGETAGGTGGTSQETTGGAGGTLPRTDGGDGTVMAGGTVTTGGGGGGGATGYTCRADESDINACPRLGPLDGRLVQFPCADSPPTDDCRGLGYVVDGIVTECSEGRSEMVLDHPIEGTPGARYLVTMHFYGIMEPKNLGPGVTREAAPLVPNRNGGSPLPWATAPAGANHRVSDYSAYELRVHDEGGQEVAQYFLNSDVSEGHWTFLIDYEKTIEVVAGGFVRLRRYDPNCRLIKNCGATGSPPCAPKARIIDLSAAEPSPTYLFQPGLGKAAEHAGQWWFIDVIAVEPL